MSMKEEYTAIDMSTAAADGFRDGQRAANAELAAPAPEPVSPWISVEERLPEIGERVIVFTGEVEEAFYWTRKPGVHDGEDGFCDLFDNDVEVSHWMPLPPPPKQIKEPGHE